MKRLILATLLLSAVAGADGKSWLVKCDSAAAATGASTKQALRAAGVNVLGTTLKRDRTRDDVCGQGGTLIGIFLRNADLGPAKSADPFLKDAPVGFPAEARRVH